MALLVKVAEAKGEQRQGELLVGCFQSFLTGLPTIVCYSPIPSFTLPTSFLFILFFTDFIYF